MKKSINGFFLINDSNDIVIVDKPREVSNIVREDTGIYKITLKQRYAFKAFGNGFYHAQVSAETYPVDSTITVVTGYASTSTTIYLICQEAAEGTDVDIVYADRPIFFSINIPKRSERQAS